MLTSHHIYAVKNIMSKGAVSDDFHFSNALILHFLTTTRALLIKDKLRSYETIGYSSYQTICLELEEGDFHTCCGITLPSTCKILKSKLPLPEMLNYRSTKLLRVLTLGGEQLNKSSLTQKKYSEFALTKPKRSYFVHDNYLYVLNDALLKVLLIEGVFSDPKESEKFCTAGQPNCKTLLDAEFPIDADLIPKLYELTTKQLLLTDASTRDTGNDSHSTNNREERQS